MSKKAPKPKDDQTYDLRDIVLAKIRGYPSWPAMIVDPEAVPAGVKKERPAGKKTTFYCVRFFPVGDYSWVLAKDLSRLRKHEIEAYISEPHKKSGELLSGYRIALDPETWEKERDEQQQEIDDAEAEAEVDELEGEEEIDDDKPAKPKKRKRESEPAPRSKSKPKKEKKGSAEPMGKKKKATSERSDKTTEKGAKSKKNGAKSKTMVESEDEGDREGADDAGPSKASPPPTKRARRDKDGDDEADLENDPEAQKVKEWRHKLQRGFLGKGPPKEEDIGPYDGIFTTVEDFDMNIKYLQFSKIGKVMRHIAALDSDKIPRDAEFKFKDRAQALVNKWHQTISTTKTNGTNGAVEEPTSKTTGTKGNGAEMEVDKIEAEEMAAAAKPVEPTEAANAELMDYATWKPTADGGDDAARDVAMAEA